MNMALTFISLLVYCSFSTPVFHKRQWAVKSSKTSHIPYPFTNLGLILQDYVLLEAVAFDEPLNNDGILKSVNHEKFSVLQLETLLN